MKIKFTIFWPVWHTVSLYKKCENYVKANCNLFIYLFIYNGIKHIILFLTNQTISNHLQLQLIKHNDAK